MDFKHTVDGEVVIVSLSGKIMGGEDTILCRDRLHRYVDEGKKHFIMDMGDVEWTNSQGLGMLIGCYISVKRAGGNLLLARTANINAILEMTRLNQVFDCFGSVEEALSSFAS
jgi:anti-anti-sigma factor